MTPTKSLSRLTMMFGIGTTLLLGASVARAQIGSGWTQYYPSKGYSGWSQSQRYSISGNVEHFWTYTSDPIVVSGSGPRSEWHVLNSYTTGAQQFQGDLNPENGTSSYTCFQIFGNATSGATAFQAQMRSGNGTLRRYNTEVLATGCWGVYTRVNVIHYATTGNGSIEVWINGSKVGTYGDGGSTSHYFKYGVYDTASATSYVGDYWRGVSFFKDGNSSGGGGGFSGWYQINDRNSGKDAAVEWAATTNGAPVILYTFGSAHNDEWELTPTDSGYYKIVNRHSSLVMAVQGASTSQGAKVIQWSYGSAQNDQWKPVDVGGGYYKFVNRHSGLVLDVTGAGTGNLTPFEQWGDNGGANQQFKLISTP